MRDLYPPDRREQAAAQRVALGVRFIGRRVHRVMIADGHPVRERAGAAVRASPMAFG